MNTKKKRLPSGKEVEIVEYIEAGVLLDVEKEEDATAFLLKSLVISLDNSKEDVYGRIRKLNLKDYRFIDSILIELMSEETEGLKD